MFVPMLISLLLLVPVMSFIGIIPVMAADADTACQGISAAGGNCGGGDAEVNSVIESSINILLFIVGVASVIALIVGGIRYIVSGGDQQAIASAKNTVMYAIIGLVVAMMAYAIVTYVFDHL